MGKYIRCQPPSVSVAPLLWEKSRCETKPTHGHRTPAVCSLLNRWQSGYIVSFKTYLICIYLYIVVILLYYVILVYCSYINLSWIGGPIFGRQLGTFLPEPSPSCNLTACHAFNHRFSERYPGVYSYKMWKTQESRGKRSSLQEDKSSTNRHVFLVGGWASPLKNLSSSVGIIIPNIRGNNKCSKPPTR